MEDKYKIVEFHVYCPQCKYEESSEEEDHCYECLQEPARLNSHKPLNFTAK